MKVNVTILTLAGLVAMGAASTDLYLAAIPSIVAEFSAGHYEGQLTLGIFMLGLALGQLLHGPLSDYFGRKPVLFGGLSVYCLTTLACAWAISMDWLLVMRFLQAIAAACGPVVARAVVNDLYRGRRAMQVMAVLAAAMALFPMLAPIMGSWLLYWFSWRSNFYALAAFAVLLWFGVVSLSESNAHCRRGKFQPGRIISQLWILPRVTLFTGHTVVGSMMFAGMFAWITSCSFIVIELIGLPAQYFGFTFTAVVVGYIAGATVSSRLVAEHGAAGVQLLGLCCAALGAGAFALVALFDQHSLPMVIAPMVCYFMGAGMVLPNAQMGSVQSVNHGGGAASSVYGFYQTIAGAGSGYLIAATYNESLVPMSVMLIAVVFIATLAYYRLIVGAENSGME